MNVWLLYNLFNNFMEVSMSATSSVTSREVIHNFSAVAARVAAGEELTVTRYGKPLLKLVQVPAVEMSQQEREAWVQQILAIRMAHPLGKKFERSDAYDE